MTRDGTPLFWKARREVMFCTLSSDRVLKDLDEMWDRKTVEDVSSWWKDEKTGRIKTDLIDRVLLSAKLLHCIDPFDVKSHQKEIFQPDRSTRIPVSTSRMQYQSDQNNLVRLSTDYQKVSQKQLKKKLLSPRNTRNLCVSETRCITSFPQCQHRCFRKMEIWEFLQRNLIFKTA